MDENKSLAVINRDANIQIIQTISAVAPNARALGFQESQAIMMMLKCYELGLSISSAFEFLDWIDGKVAIKPKGALALIHKSHLVDVKLTRLLDSNKAFAGYKCNMRRRDTGFEHEVSFTLEDAKRAQLTEGSPSSKGTRGYGNWEKYPENMCLWRSVGFCADVVCPDLLGGMLRPDDLGASVNQDGEPIKSNFEISKPPTVAQQQEAKENAPDIAGLIAMFPIERVLSANGGVLPGTQAQVEAIVSRLAEEDRIAALKSDSPTAVEP